MVTLRCTKKLLKFLETSPLDEPEPPTGALGDWYGNVIWTEAGDLILFVNERSLLTVAIPAWEVENLIPMFLLRVENILAMIDTPTEIIEREMSHLSPIQFAKTANRSVLGSMNDIAYQFQFKAERDLPNRSLSLSDAEFEVCEMPCGPLDYQFPREVAMQLLQKHSNLGAL